MDKSVLDFYVTQSFEDYERSHEQRFKYLIQDLRLDQIQNSQIADFGCGGGSLFARLPKNNNKFYGFDGANIDFSPYRDIFKYQQVDLDLPFAEEFLKSHLPVEYGCSFETMEHLCNPYNFLFEVKKIIKIGGMFYLSVPAEDCGHNVIYPSLIFTVDNFLIFLRQMAFQVLSITRHDKAFSQNVFVLINREWRHKKMLISQYDKKFLDVPPHVIVNS